MRLPSEEQLDRVQVQHTSVLMVLAIRDSRLLRSRGQPEDIKEAWKDVPRTHTSPLQHCLEFVCTEYYKFEKRMSRSQNDHIGSARPIFQDCAGLLGIYQRLKQLPVPDVDYDIVLADLELALDSVAHGVSGRNVVLPMVSSSANLINGLNISNFWSMLCDKWNIFPLADGIPEVEAPGTPRGNFFSPMSSPSLRAKDRGSDKDLSTDATKSPDTPKSHHTLSRRNINFQVKECQRRCILLEQCFRDVCDVVQYWEIARDAWATWYEQDSQPSPTVVPPRDEPKKGSWYKRLFRHHKDR